LWAWPGLVDTRDWYQRDVHQGGSSMPRTHRPYPPEFRAEAVRLVRESGKPM